MTEKGGMIRAKSFKADISVGTDRQIIKGRLLGLAIDQHLNCLKRKTGMLMQDDSADNNHDKALIKWFNYHSEYLNDLGRKSIISYFLTVEFNVFDRIGYWEQVADYLRWLAGLMEVEAFKDNVKALEKVRSLAGFCYELAGIEKNEMLMEYLFEKPQRSDKGKEWECRRCDSKGIELIRLQPDDYDDFTERMLKVLEKELLKSKGEYGLDLEGKYEEFIKRLLKIEVDRHDLRIKDLELRYKSKTVTDTLDKEYCWPWPSEKQTPAQKKKIKDFGLLPCPYSPEEIAAFPTTMEQKDNNLPPSTRYERVMERWDDDFLRHLESPSIHEKQESGLYFLGLQRWNSSSPAEGYSLGGGYLLYHLDQNNTVSYGIAIDPGFDFIRNLFHMGFSLNDIDIVLISHAHIDHIRDFESIVTLLLELAKRKKQYRKVHVILTLGIYRRLEYIIENPKLRMHIEPYIIDIDREIETTYFEDLPVEDSTDKPNSSFCFELLSNNAVSRFQAKLPKGNDDYTIRVRPTRAYHDDFTGYSDSFGFLIDIRTLGEDKCMTVGYTGDTKWIYPEIEDLITTERTNKQARRIKGIIEQYNSCDTLVVHLGSLIGRNKESGSYNFLDYNQCTRKDPKTPCEDLVCDKGHPYLIGLLRTLSSIYKSPQFNMPLVLLSEFGEELRGKIRVDLVERLINVYGDKMQLLPMDVGINVQLGCESKAEKSGSSMLKKKISCVQCNRLVPIGEANFEHYGPDEAIYCVCKTCYKGTPFDVLQNRLRQLYEVGYELHPAKRNH